MDRVVEIDKGKLHLGVDREYNSCYNPELLTAIPRSINRDRCGIDSDKFIGVDIWHGYEISFLLDNGLPVVGVLKLSVSAQSKYIVESKSFKLYLNSFNNEKLGLSVEVAIDRFCSIVKVDLSNLLEVDVQLALHRELASSYFDFDQFISIDSVDYPDVDLYSSERGIELLKENSNETESKFCSQLLRSNCRVTGQPDWGDLYIYIEGVSKPDRISLLKYIISLRNENHFHEEICEQIYSDIMVKFKPKELLVAALYTRRGGIDICPVRASSDRVIPKYLSDISIFSRGSFRQ